MAAKKKATTKTVTRTKAPALKVVPNPAPTAMVTSSAKIANQQNRMVATGELKQHPKNAKQGNVTAIGESIHENDFYGTVLVQKSTNFILAGNHKVQAAVAAGLPEVPAMFIDCDDVKAERILLADNKIAELGTYDQRALQALLEDQKRQTGSLVGTGYNDDDLAKMTAKQGPPASFPEFDEQVKVSYTCPNCHFKWS